MNLYRNGKWKAKGWWQKRQAWSWVHALLKERRGQIRDRYFLLFIIMMSFSLPSLMMASSGISEKYNHWFISGIWCTISLVNGNYSTALPKRQCSSIKQGLCFVLVIDESQKANWHFFLDSPENHQPYMRSCRRDLRVGFRLPGPCLMYLALCMDHLSKIQGGPDIVFFVLAWGPLF